MGQKKCIMKSKTLCSGCSRDKQQQISSIQ